MTPIGSSTIDSSYRLLTDYNRYKTFDLIEMRNKAVAFSNGDNLVFQYIDNILEENEFQKDPTAYLEAWSKRRGTSEISKYPEDYARPFFDNNFPSQPEDFSPPDTFCKIL